MITILPHWENVCFFVTVLLRDKLPEVFALNSLNLTIYSMRFEAHCYMGKRKEWII